jgi:hypothetical protein
MSYAAASVQRAGRVIFPVALSATLAIGVALDFHERFVSSEIRDTAQKYQGIDLQMASASNGDGVFLHFTGFDPPLNWIPLDIYQRAVFSLYPTKVLAADPKAVIFDFDQLQAANFDPDAQWMLNNGTPVEVTYARQPQTGALTFTVQRVSNGAGAR